MMVAIEQLELTDAHEFQVLADEASILRAEDFGLPSDIDLIERFDERLFLCDIPIDHLVRGDVPVDAKHVAKLAQLMREEVEHQERGGQLEPGLVAQVVGPDSAESKLYLCNGFHRVEAHLVNGHRSFFSMLKTDCTIEDVYDLRIIAATTHKPVTFARVVEWVTDAWSLTYLSKKITVGQAFTFVAVPAGLTGERMGLTRDEAEVAKLWVERKCAQWGRPASSIYQYLILYQKASPELVRQTRVGGRKGEELTPAQLRAIAHALPLDYPSQERVASVAVAHGLTEATTRRLAILVGQANTPEEIDDLLAQDWRKPIDIVERSMVETVAAPIRRPGLQQRVAERQTLAEASVRESGLIARIWDLEVESAQLLITLAELQGAIAVTPRPSVVGAAVESEQDTISGNKVSPTEDKEQVAIEEIERTFQEKESIDIGQAPELQATIDAAKAGNFDQLFALFTYFIQDSLTGYLRSRFTATDDDVEDVIQEMWIKVMEKMPDFELRGFKPLVSWFFEIAKSVYIDKIREASKFGGELLELEEETIAVQPPRYLVSSGMMAVTEPVKRAIILGLETKLQRRVVIMKFFLGLTNQEIAHCLGLTEGAVKSLQHRALATLQKIVGPEWQLD